MSLANTELCTAGSVSSTTVYGWAAAGVTVSNHAAVAATTKLMCFIKILFLRSALGNRCNAIRAPLEE